MLKNVRELEGIDDFKRDGVFYFPRNLESFDGRGLRERINHVDSLRRLVEHRAI